MGANDINVIEGPYIISANSIQHAADVGIVLAAGIEPAATSFVSLTSTELYLQLGIPEVGPSLKMTDEEVEITFGPPEIGSSITMNAEGISLAVGPTTSLKLTPAGIVLQGAQVQIEAMTSYELTTVSLDETAANVSRSAAITQIE